jgi:biopolymer transport protein ExbD
MALNLSSGEDDEVISFINTTPLVDVMLVLLIIFLITIPVVTSSVPVQLPNERNTPREAQSHPLIVSVDAQGRLYWFETPLRSSDELLERLRALPKNPEPEIHLRGDQRGHFEPVGRVMGALQQAGFTRLRLITQPE